MSRPADRKDGRDAGENKKLLTSLAQTADS